MPPKKASRVKRSRTRSGCFTCRDRHIKCDEQQPVCQNCINSKRKCYRGVRLNFLQYTIYDPKKASSPGPRQEVPQLPEVKFYRILDQSIPVSSLYENGPQIYGPYKHLHSPDDLNDAHRIFFQDLHSNATTHVPVVPLHAVSEPNMSLDYSNITYMDAPPIVSNDAWPLPMNLNDQSSFNFGDHTVLENFEIRNVLMNPHMANAYGASFYDEDPAVQKPMDEIPEPIRPPVVPSRKNSRARVEAAVHPEFMTTPQDAERFVHLIHTQNYSWLLDNFNELKVWSSFVPNYAVRLAQTAEQGLDNTRSRSSQRFLLDCLLLCTDTTPLSRIMDQCTHQLSEWAPFATKDVTVSSFTAFEKFLASVVLTTYALLIHTTSPGFVASPNFKMTLANQGRLIHQLAARYQRISEAKLKRLPTSVLIIASFHALLIIRFFLRMRLQKVFNVAFEPITDVNHNIFRPLDLEISYTPHSTYDVAEFFTLSSFEANHLRTLFQEFDLPQENSDSDSSKLRLRLWGVIFMDYFPEEEQNHVLAMMDSSDSKHDASEASVLIPNPKGTAMRILVEYSRKLSKDPQSLEEADAQLEDIFTKIDHTFMPQNIKANWQTYFGWSKH